MVFAGFHPLKARCRMVVSRIALRGIAQPVGEGHSGPSLLTLIPGDAGAPARV